MRETLDLLIRLNLAAAAAILAVMLLRWPARRLFGARIAYGLWGLPPLAALAMLIPTRIVILPRPSPDVAEIPAAVALGTKAALAPVLAPTLVRLTDAFDVAPWAAAVWAGGAVLALASLWRSQIRFERAAREGRAGPAVVGLLRPRIVTPRDFDHAYTAQERRMVLAHEATHVARHDSRINSLAALVRSLNWFNPCLWLMARQLRIDQEFACDEAVMARYPRSRRAYGEALLKTQLAACPLPLGCYWPPEAVHPLVARVGLLTRPPADAMTRALGLTALALTVLSGAGAVWAARPPRLEFSPSHEAVILDRAVRMAPPMRVADGRALPRPEPRPADPPGPPAPSSTAYYGAAPDAPATLDLAVARPDDARLIPVSDMEPMRRDLHIRGAAELSSVEPGQAVRVLATMVDGQGIQLTTDLTAFGSQSLYRVGYFERNGSRLKLFTSVVQHGDRYRVTAALNGSFRPEITGSIDLPAGGGGTIHLPTGDEVSVHVYPRAETAEETAAAAALHGRRFVNIEQFERSF